MRIEPVRAHGKRANADVRGDQLRALKERVGNRALFRILHRRAIAGRPVLEHRREIEDLLAPLAPERRRRPIERRGALDLRVRGEHRLLVEARLDPEGVDGRDRQRVVLDPREEERGVAAHVDACGDLANRNHVEEPPQPSALRAVERGAGGSTGLKVRLARLVVEQPLRIGRRARADDDRDASLRVEVANGRHSRIEAKVAAPHQRENTLACKPENGPDLSISRVLIERNDRVEEVIATEKVNDNHDLVRRCERCSASAGERVAELEEWAGCAETDCRDCALANERASCDRHVGLS